MLSSGLSIRPNMTYGELRNYAAQLGVTVFSDHLPKGVNGIYDDECQTIVIDRDVTYRVKRCTLVHELIHWLYRDDACNGHTHNKHELRTRREAATVLISPKLYQVTGDEYCGEGHLMAIDLDVTMQVLRDYKELVLDRRQYI